MEYLSFFVFKLFLKKFLEMYQLQQLQIAGSYRNEWKLGKQGSKLLAAFLIFFMIFSLVLDLFIKRSNSWK